MNIEVGPTGKIVTGTVFDTHKAGLERSLKNYDNLLYLKWNPNKRGGIGCWEVRRKPERKTAIYDADFQGMSILSIEYVENNLVSHILDLPYLTDRALDKIKSMDTGADRRWVNDMEYREQKAQEKIKASADDDRRYMARYYRSAIEDFRQAVLSGQNPNQIVNHWGSKS